MTALSLRADSVGAFNTARRVRSHDHSAEAGLKPRAAADWHVLDKSIDRALEALRADKPTPEDCKAAMSALLKSFDTLAGQT